MNNTIEHKNLVIYVDSSFSLNSNFHNCFIKASGKLHVGSCRILSHCCSMKSRLETTSLIDTPKNQNRICKKLVYIFMGSKAHIELPLKFRKLGTTMDLRSNLNSILLATLSFKFLDLFFMFRVYLYSICFYSFFKIRALSFSFREQDTH